VSIPLAAAASAQGTWSPIYDWSWEFTGTGCAYEEISHAALIPVGHYKGMVLLWHHSCNGPTGEAEAWIFNPADPTNLYKVSPTTAVNIFCSGQSWNSAGRLITAGGWVAPSAGYKDSFLFDPTQLGLLLTPQFPGVPIVMTNGNPWTQLGSLSIDRYYPTVVPLNRRTVSACGGTVGSAHLVLGGPPAITNEGMELWELIPQTSPTCTMAPVVPPVGAHTVGGAIEPYLDQGNPDLFFDSYPRAFQLSSDQILVAHDVHTDAMAAPPNTPGQSWLIKGRYGAVTDWTLIDGPNGGTTPSGDRDYGTAVLMHMIGDPDRVFAFGGSQPNPAPPPALVMNTTLQEFDASTSTWVTHTPTGTNPSARKFANAVVLPTGQVLVVGGTSVPTRCQQPVFSPVLYTPGAPGSGLPGHGTSMAASTIDPVTNSPTPRLYHSVAMLLPDASVFVAGGEDYMPCPGSGPWPSSEYTGEVFTPPYPSYRPTINLITGPIGFAPGVPSFSVQATTVQGSVGKVVLVRPGAVTHHFDADQRYIELDFSASTKVAGPVTLTVTPPTDNLGPAGYYLLFVLENGAQGLAPSVSGSFIQML
jgi:hypothetical protein